LTPPFAIVLKKIPDYTLKIGDPVMYEFPPATFKNADFYECFVKEESDPEFLRINEYRWVTYDSIYQRISVPES
jgi:hypothetical protein